MAERDVTFDIIARDKTGGPVRSAAEGLDKLGDKADKAQRKVDELGDETGQLARKMLEAKAAAAALAREFDKTGDSKVLKDFEKLNREANRLGRVMRAIEPPKVLKAPDVDTGMFAKLVTEAKKAGLLAGDAVVEGMGDVFKAIPGPVKGALVGGLVTAAVIAAPGIAAAVEGAVLAGVGAAGIGAGIALAARDPQVAQAYSKLGSDIMSDLSGASKPFVGELLAAAPKLGAAFDRELPLIRRTLASLSTGVGPLVDGVIGAVHELLPGIQAAANASLPILRAVGTQLPTMGRAIGNLLTSISLGGPAAGAALQEVLRDVTLLINLMAFGAKAAAPFLNTLAQAGDLLGIADAGSGTVSVLSDTIGQSGGQASVAGTQFAALGNAMGSTTAQADALNTAFARLFSEEMGVDQANLAVNVGMANLRETIKDNKKTLDESNESGRQNVGVILGQVQALEAKRQADIAAGNGTVEATNTANAAYASNVASLRAVLIQLGLAPAAVDALLAKYQQIPKTLTTTITTVYRTKGTPPGYSDQLTGHSRTGANDTSSISSWAPAQFAASQRAQLAGNGGGTHRTGGPTPVHSEVNVAVNLDGQPFRAYTEQAVSAAEKRQAWRAKVGKR